MSRSRFEESVTEFFSSLSQVSWAGSFLVMRWVEVVGAAIGERRERELRLMGELLVGSCCLLMK